MRTTKAGTTALVVGMMLGSLSLAGPATAQPDQIVVSSTIQAAVDMARSGDTIIIPAGIYRESVLINKPGLTVVGAPGAILDGEGLDARTGLAVRAPSGTRLSGFTLRGLQVQNFDATGVLLSGVDGFRLTGTTYVDNEVYGLFPVRCSHGRVDHNRVTGSKDSGVYVGQCSDVLVDHNVAHGNTIGIEIELSTHIDVVDNVATDNAVGAVVQVLPGRPATVTDDVLVRANVLSGNDRPNPVIQEPGGPIQPLALLPGGVGFVNIAGDNVRIEGNIVSGNPSVGIAVVGLPPELLPPGSPVDPSPDDGIVIGNVTAGNGRNPDPRLSPLPGADVVWDRTGSSCFSVSRAARTFPSPLPSC